MTAHETNKTNPEDSSLDPLDRLLQGYRRFRDGKPNHSNQKILDLLKTSHPDKQKPFAVIIGCSDSRVPPEFIFDCGLGELFVIRIAGNVIDPDVKGSLEYAIEHLNVSLVVVMGHERCGAVSATLDHVLKARKKAKTATSGYVQNEPKKAETDSINNIITKIEPAVQKTLDKFPKLLDNKLREEALKKLREEALEEAVRANVDLVYNELNELVKSKYPNNPPFILNGRYDLDDGEVDFWRVDEDNKRHLIRFITICNKLQSEINMYLISDHFGDSNSDNERKIYMSLAPNMNHILSSFVNDSWEARIDNKVVGKYTCQEKGPDWIIE